MSPEEKHEPCHSPGLSLSLILLKAPSLIPLLRVCHPVILHCESDLSPSAYVTPSGIMHVSTYLFIVCLPRQTASFMGKWTMTVRIPAVLGALPLAGTPETIVLAWVEERFPLPYARALRHLEESPPSRFSVRTARAHPLLAGPQVLCLWHPAGSLACSPAGWLGLICWPHSGQALLPRSGLSSPCSSVQSRLDLPEALHQPFCQPTPPCPSRPAPRGLPLTSTRAGTAWVHQPLPTRELFLCLELPWGRCTDLSAGSFLFLQGKDKGPLRGEF